MKRSALAVLCLLVFSCPGWTQTAIRKQNTLAYLHKLRNDDGGYRPTMAAGPSSLRATSTALRALKYFGGAPLGPNATANFVKGCFDRKTGGFADRPGGAPDVVVTAIGLMALVELKLPVRDYEKAAIGYLADNAKGFEQVRMAAAGLEAVGRRSTMNKSWLAELVRMQNADGTFAKDDELPRRTGGAVAAVLRLGGKIADPAPVLRALNAGQRADGGFGKGKARTSDLDTSYRVMRTYVMLKGKPMHPSDLRNFVADCRNADGGYGVARGQPSSVSGTYFASIILHWLAAME